MYTYILSDEDDQNFENRVLYLQAITSSQTSGVHYFGRFFPIRSYGVQPLLYFLFWCFFKLVPIQLFVYFFAVC